MTTRILDLDRFSVALRRGRRAPVPVLDELSLAVAEGEMTALVGESGSGKTITALAIMRLLPDGAAISGSARLAGTDLTRLTETAMRQIRGAQIGMVFQNPLAALNPSTRVGAQIAEAYRLHTGDSAKAARARALDLLGEVGIPEPGARIDDYPHQFSGGMRQRVMIAIALACSPKLLIADEPTSGLDTLTARQILALLARLRREYRLGVLFITHDLSIVEAHADRVTVLYAGRQVEWGAARSLFAAPRHPYSQALLASVPRLGSTRLAAIPGNLPDPEDRPPGCRFAPRCRFREPACETAYPAPERFAGTDAACRRAREIAPDAAITAENPPTARRPRGPILLSADRLGVAYDGNAPGLIAGLFRRKQGVQALCDASFTLDRGGCLGIVGQSGSGKSTLGRAILQMLPYRGAITLDRTAFASMDRRAAKAQRRRIQVVFQDPRESLNPRLPVGEIVSEPLLLAGERHRSRRWDEASHLLGRVGLSERLLPARPGSLSGGQAQRVAIARALAAKPDIIVFDEPTSSLDVSTQALLLNLLKDLAEADDISYILISHDLVIVAYMADAIAVLNAGRIVEYGETAQVLGAPRDAYTRTLIEASPHLVEATRRRHGTASSQEIEP